MIKIKFCSQLSPVQIKEGSIPGVLKVDLKLSKVLTPSRTSKLLFAGLPFQPKPGPDPDPQFRGASCKWTPAILWALCNYAALLESEKRKADHLVTAVILYFWRALCTKVALWTSVVALFASPRCLHEYFGYLEYFEYFGLEFLRGPKKTAVQGWMVGRCEMINKRTTVKTLKEWHGSLSLSHQWAVASQGKVGWVSVMVGSPREQWVQAWFHHQQGPTRVYQTSVQPATKQWARGCRGQQTLQYSIGLSNQE